MASIGNSHFVKGLGLFGCGLPGFTMGSFGKVLFRLGRHLFGYYQMLGSVGNWGFAIVDCRWARACLQSRFHHPS